MLWKILAEQGLALPYTITQTEKNTLKYRFSDKTQVKDVFQLRYKGLSEKLEPQEIGYCLYHIANHRGSSSVRTDLDTVETGEDKTLREMQAVIDEDVKKDKNISFIEILIKDNEARGFSAFRRSDKNKSVRIPTREVILNEVKKLLETQQKQYPELFTDEYIERIYTAVNFENVKIVPESGFRPFFTQERRLPKCHFLNEERRLWEALNNAFIKIPVQRSGTLDWEKQELTVSEKQILFGFLRKGNRLTETGVKKLLPAYSGASYKFSLQGKTEDSQKIEGFRFTSLEDKNFWKRLPEKQQDAFLFDWVNCPDDQQLTEKLVTQYGLTDDEAWDALRTVKLIGDYAPVGKSAMLALLPHIKNGKSWTEAVDICVDEGLFNTGEKKKIYEFLPYYGEVLTGRTQAIMGKAWHSAFEEKRKSAGFTKPKTSSDEETFGRIANPVVHQCLNELRKLMNELTTVLDKPPAEIGLEVSRELKLGQEKRDRLIKQ